MQNFLQQLAANIRFADIFDMLFVAVLLYAALAWFRQRATRSLLIGLTTILLVYVIARSLDMYLTTRLFQGGFVLLVMLLVVIFQQDLRRGFERFASAGLFQQSKPDPRADLVETVVEAAVMLAEHRTGALIVFEGREPLDHHIRGGTPLNGRISLPLLQSIFQTGSIGHDGAAIVQDDQLLRFGAHLPLSKNHALLGSRGTRHAAALGLAEVSDALVVVVSEERGTISIAQHATLQKIDAVQLTARLAQHYEERNPGQRTGHWSGLVFDQISLKLLSVGLAFALWLLIAYRVDPLQRTYVVPIEYRNLPANWIVEEPRPSSVSVTLTGSERAFDLLEANTLRVSLDLAHVRAEQAYQFPTQTSLSKLPAELSVGEIEPATIAIRVRMKPTAPTGKGEGGRVKEEG